MVTLSPLYVLYSGSARTAGSRRSRTIKARVTLRNIETSFFLSVAGGMLLPDYRNGGTFLDEVQAGCSNARNNYRLFFQKVLFHPSIPPGLKKGDEYDHPRLSKDRS